LVGERIQRIVDGADDPTEATDELGSTLVEYGIGPDIHCPPDQAGNWLVWSNLAVAERFQKKGLLRDMTCKTPEEMVLARGCINKDAENDDAIGWLQTWAWRLSQL
jgi:hypothetical protein